MSEELSKVYSPKEIEDKWYKIWEEKGYFNAQHNDDKPGYSIVIPPPNVTGILHMGHMLNNSIQDTIVRWKRMKGFDTLWVPGTDHAGIATQNKVEKWLAENGTSKEEIGREAFLEKTLEWKEKHGGLITNQMRKLGSSLDWSRERFTMDKGLSDAVRKVFVDLYNDGLIYKGEYIVNWCPHDKTALADDEIDHVEKEGKIWEIRYKIKDSDDYVVVATTRPETMLGDTGVAVNPNDERYKHLIGKSVILPLMDREIPVVADEYVDMEFGTGVVKMTPAHDPNDFEVAKRTGLPMLNIFTEDAHVNENGGKYKGLERFKARKEILKDLEEQGYLVGEKKHNNSVGHCYRCNTIIEPRVSEQWFVRMKPLAERALEVVRNGEITITPKRQEKIYYNWLENIRDWCISRQIWWGHRIPAYYAEDGTMFVAENLEDAKKESIAKYGKEVPLREETDVLDTWFSSALWPFSTMGWPETSKDFDKFFPTDALVTAADIIFFWVARMIMMSLYVHDKIPFNYVYFHGVIRDEQGRKMSKSLGNSPDPVDLMNKYGADAIRFSLLFNTSQGQDIHFSEKLLEMGSSFSNKVWNASKFVLSNLEDFDYSTSVMDLEFKLEDRWILSKLQSSSKKINEAMENYELDTAAKTAYEFFRGDFCDWYVEIAKTRVYGNEGIDKITAQWILRHVLDNGLRILHPFMPYITEEIWQKVKLGDETIMLVEFPEEDKSLVDTNSEKEFDYLREVITAIRNIRGEANVSPSRKIEVMFKTSDATEKAILESNAKILDKLANVEKYAVALDPETIKIPKLVGYRLALKTEIYIPLNDLVDKEKEIDKLKKDIEKTQKELDRVISKLSNEAFTSKAPKEVIEKENRIKEELETKIEKFNETIALYI
ncbi:MAG: valine--tRNA ligase [Leptotrichiaceae bacterium]|jgi:valyl-tRNA synthetase|nr:valine--tRNA ligase [Leptotrichiaceae bacterium]MBP6167639.1 valine--tRNA ligase [Leptotrichiaceae bacterium]MBP7026591.1 valine--tRNA ligase [Leptotrichiaceae bacterium]MBP8637240.1 valine--tRNA ligase [Leptotrichiaceae bacterium]MBP9538571.1 valine--tRNA ligase [Leptotrichiaceae bacterium]